MARPHRHPPRLPPPLLSTARCRRPRVAKTPRPKSPWGRSSLMHLANYLGYLHRAELNLAEGFRKVGETHAEEADVYHICNTLAGQCEAHAEKLQPFVERYG